MKFKRSALKKNAKKALKGRYWKALLATIIVALIVGAAGSFTGVSFIKTVNPGSSQPALQSSDNDALTESFEPEEFSFDELTDPEVALNGLMPSGSSSESSVAATDPAETITSTSRASLPSMLLSILVVNVLLVGSAWFFIRCRQGEAEIGDLFYGFTKGYGNNVGVMFLRDIFTVLWGLLFVIPGIVKSYEYSMIPYILAENPGMAYKEAFGLSKKLTKGNKWKLFMLDLSFLGWYILGVLTAGIGLIFVRPYVCATKAEAYETLKAAAGN